jgi:hypothetical protein
MYELAGDFTNKYVNYADPNQTQYNYTTDTRFPISMFSTEKTQ